MRESVSETDSQPTKRHRRWWLLSGIIVLPLVAYGVTYVACCQRMVNGSMNHVLPRWLDDYLLVLAPSGTCGLFFPAACAESLLRGCWRGVMVTHLPTGERWDLSTCPWRFMRQQAFQ